MTESFSSASAASGDRPIWTLVNSDDTRQTLPDLDVVFRQQPRPVEARHRIAYRTSLLVLVLGRFNKQSAKISSVHTLTWAMRSARTRRMFQAWWDGRRSYNTITERLDPDLEITLNLALVDGVVTTISKGARIRLTDNGSHLAELIDSEPKLLTKEKAFLERFPRLSDSSLEKKLGVTPK